MAAIQVNETSVEGQNVQRAIDFVRDMGHYSKHGLRYTRCRRRGLDRCDGWLLGEN